MGKKGLCRCKYDQKWLVGRGKIYPKQPWAEMGKELGGTVSVARRIRFHHFRLESDEQGNLKDPVNPV